MTGTPFDAGTDRRFRGSSPTVAERFWARVDMAGPQDCWPWKLKPCPQGYGRLFWREGGHLHRAWAHRLSWEIANGCEWPEGAIARHTCDNRICVNPAHIIPGTVAENNQDAVERKRQNNKAKTHCSRGHPLSGDNLIERKHGWRACRTCQNVAQKRWRQAK